MMDLKHYVLENKTSLRSLAQSIRTKSGATGNLTVGQMRELVYGLISEESMKALIDRSITEIEIPSGVTAIGMYAFQRCNSLTTVKFNEGLETLGQNCFALCNSLKKIDLPHGVKVLNFAAFQNTPLDEISLPNTLETIAQYALVGTKLTTLTIPNSITSINQSALPTSLKTIYCDWAEGEKPTVEANAPWGATNAEIIYLRKGSTPGVQFALNTEGTAYTVTGFNMDQYNAEELDLVIADTYRGLPVTAIAEYAFDRSGAGSPIIIKTVELPDTLEKIGRNAFSDQSLTSVTIPDSVNEVGAYAFQYNYQLTTATLGSGCLWRMAENVFEGCSALTDIYVPWDSGNNDGASWGATNARIHYPDLPDEYT